MDTLSPPPWGLPSPNWILCRAWRRRKGADSWPFFPPWGEWISLGCPRPSNLPFSATLPWTQLTSSNVLY